MEAWLELQSNHPGSAVRSCETFCEAVTLDEIIRESERLSIRRQNAAKKSTSARRVRANTAQQDRRSMKSDDLNLVRTTLWKAADELRANSTLAPNEYRAPAMGLIVLAYAEHLFEQVRPEVEAAAPTLCSYPHLPHR